MDDDKVFLEKAIELALENKAKGGRPFGAILVRDNKIIATGINNMLTTFDPSSHAEMEVIRKATANFKTFDLKGYRIFASGHPCPMCLAAIAMLNIDEIIYAFDNNDATPFGYSSQPTYDKLGIAKIDFIKIKKLKTKHTAKQLYE